MLSNDITVPTLSNAVSAELGRSVIGTLETLSLLSTLDAGVTIRANARLGSLKVSHQKTKELGGATRHALRLDLPQNGDLPPAFVNLVICGVAGQSGTNRALTAFATLLGALVNHGLAIDAETLTEGTAESPALLFANILASEADSGSSRLVEALSKVLNGEG
jgi:hypothetical protein